MLFDDRLFDDLTEKAKASPRLRMHYDLRDSADDGSMRMLNALEPGTVIPIHRHNDTSEEVICLRGVVEEIIYDSNGTEISRYRLGPSVGCLACKVPTGEFHTCVSLESGSVIFEFKNGKYNPQTTEDFLPNPPSAHPASPTDILTISSGSTPSNPTAASSSPSAHTSACVSAQTSACVSEQSVSASTSTTELTQSVTSDSSASLLDSNQLVSSTFIPAPDPRGFDGGVMLRMKR